MVIFKLFGNFLELILKLVGWLIMFCLNLLLNIFGDVSLLIFIINGDFVIIRFYFLVF